MRHDYGKKVLYLRLLKALYGCIKSALLWYNMNTGTLKEEGFILNPYDLCVVNKVIECKQYTTTRYVDDSKISHVDNTVVDNVISVIENYFGKMIVIRGIKHTYVSIYTEFIRNGELSLNQKPHLKECIADFGEDFTIGFTTSAQYNRFEINDLGKLSDDQHDILHSIAQKLLFVAKRSRPDL